MPRGKFDGVLQALYQSPPFRKLARAIDGQEGEMIKYYHDYFKNKVSEALWGNNWQRYYKYTKDREAKKQKPGDAA